MSALQHTLSNNLYFRSRRPTRALAFGLAVIMVLLTAKPVIANPHPPELILKDTKDVYSSIGYICYLEDPTTQLTLEQVQTSEYKSKFRTVDEILSFGLTSSSYWFHLSVTNKNSSRNRWWLEIESPILDRVETYFVYDNGEAIHHLTGDNTPVPGRAIESGMPTLPFDLYPGQHVDIYIRVQTSGSLFIPVKVWAPEKLIIKHSHRLFALGIYYGIMFALFSYNLMLFISIKDRNYLYYCIFVLTYSGLQMTLNGVSYEFIWTAPGVYGKTGKLEIIAIEFFVATTAVIAMLGFTRNFLRINENFPLLNKLILIHISLACCLYVLPLDGTTHVEMRLYTLLSLSSSILLIFCAAAAFMIGIREASYFVVAWFILLVGIITYILLYNGILPPNIFTVYGMQFGSAWEAILLSFALAYRMRLLREENERMQTEAKASLEKSVRARTLELDSAMQHLEHTNELLKDSIAEAKVANLAKSQFIASASHDLRQPLQALGIYLHILYKKFANTDPVLTKCISAFGALESLLKSILDISKIDSKAEKVSKSHFHLENIFKNLQVANEYEAKQKGIDLTIRSTPHTAFTDPQQLERILNNLINNAIRHSNSEKILLSCRPYKKYLLVQVWDFGQGIAESELNNIFKEFYRLKGHGEGLGLGLAIVKRLTNLLNIPIFVKSKEGLGTVFSLQVPYGKSELVRQGNSPTKSSVMLPGTIVLIIDDSAEIRDSMTMLIESWEGSALAAKSKEEALAFIEKEEIRPHVLIVDFMLDQDTTSIDTILTIHDILGEKIPTILISGETSSASIKAIRELQCHFLHKPIQLEELKSILRHILK